MEYRIYHMKEDVLAAAAVKKGKSLMDLTEDPENYDLFQMGKTLNYGSPETLFMGQQKIRQNLRAGDILVIKGTGFKGAWVRSDLTGSIRFQECPVFFRTVMGEHMKVKEETPKQDDKKQILKAEPSEEIVKAVTGKGWPEVKADKKPEKKPILKADHTEEIIEALTVPGGAGLLIPASGPDMPDPDTRIVRDEVKEAFQNRTQKGGWTGKDIKEAAFPKVSTDTIMENPDKKKSEPWQQTDNRPWPRTVFPAAFTFRDKILAKAQEGRDITLCLANGYRLNRAWVKEVGMDYIIVQHNEKEKMIHFSQISNVEM